MKHIRKSEWNTPCPLCGMKPEDHEAKTFKSSRQCMLQKAETVRMLNSIDLTPYNTWE